ncbi:MAG: hypothetical protein JEZ03_03005 [Bacteroidales bacterium]|nr:hypothetical protein [Bacteroidales bacterium]
MNKFLIILLGALIMSVQGAHAQGCAEPSSDEGVNVFGFIQPQVHSSLGEKPTNTFDFKRARIGVMGNIPYDFSYYVVLETSAFLGDDPYLLDAFISYKRFEWAKVSIGSFKNPFGLEVNTACSGLHTVYRSVVSDQLVSPQRDYGLMISGGDKKTFVRYSFALMNGRGLGVQDNNTMKDVVGRVVIHPTDYLYVGGSFRYGTPTTNEEERISLAAEIEVVKGDFLLQAEYIYDQGDYNRAAGGGCGSEPMILGQKRSGAWAQAMYMTPFNLQPVLKFEYFNPEDANSDGGTPDKDRGEYGATAGLNYFFNDWTRVQLNYRYLTEYDDQVILQVQVKF